MNAGMSTAKKTIPLMQRRDRLILFGAIGFSALALAGVWYNDEEQRRRRHKAIATDIERERWRAQQIGSKLGVEVGHLDDGFAKKFLSAPENAKDIAEAQIAVRKLFGEATPNAPR